MEETSSSNGGFNLGSAVKSGFVASVVMSIILALLGQNLMKALGGLIAGSEADPTLQYALGFIVHSFFGIFYGVAYALIIAPLPLFNRLVKAVIYAALLAVVSHFGMPIMANSFSKMHDSNKASGEISFIHRDYKVAYAGYSSGKKYSRDSSCGCSAGFADGPWDVIHHADASSQETNPPAPIPPVGKNTNMMDENISIMDDDSMMESMDDDFDSMYEDDEIADDSMINMMDGQTMKFEDYHMNVENDMQDDSGDDVMDNGQSDNQASGEEEGDSVSMSRGAVNDFEKAKSSMNSQASSEASSGWKTAGKNWFNHFIYAIVLAFLYKKRS